MMQLAIYMAKWFLVYSWTLWIIWSLRWEGRPFGLPRTHTGPLMVSGGALTASLLNLLLTVAGISLACLCLRLHIHSVVSFRWHVTVNYCTYYGMVELLNVYCTSTSHCPGIAGPDCQQGEAPTQTFSLRSWCADARPWAAWMAAEPCPGSHQQTQASLTSSLVQCLITIAWGFQYCNGSGWPCLWAAAAATVTVTSMWLLPVTLPCVLW